MVDVIKKLCCSCKNNNLGNKNCNKKIIIIEGKETKCYKCENYIKDESKIIPYQKPLEITAKRINVNRKDF